MSITQELLNMSLAMAVPLEVSGYLEDKDRWEADTEIIRDIGQVLACQSDELIYKQPGVTSKLFCKLTKALAWSSFQPGGIQFNGYRYEVVANKLQILAVEKT
jgi:hypothetical protein